MSVKTLLLSSLAVVAALVTLRFLVLFLEPRMTFFPIRGQSFTPAQLGIPFQELSIPTADGEMLCVWSLEHPQPRGEVVFFHGNGGNLSLWLEFLLVLHRQSLAVTALDYRGYGKSTGSPTEEGLYQDTSALINFFWARLHRPQNRVLYWGRSLGGIMAAYAATVRPPDGLILEAAFPSKQSLLNHYPLLKALAVFSRYRLPAAEFLENVACPVLIIHGNQDRIVPLAEGQKLFARLQGRKYFYEVQGADHNDLHLVDPQGYAARVGEFVEEIAHGQDPD